MGGCIAMVLLNRRLFLRRLVWLLVAICVAGIPSAHAIETDRDIDQKAKFILGFAEFVSWPENPDKESTFTIAIAESPRLYNAIYRLAMRKNKGRDQPIEVRLIESLDDLAGANLLYLGITDPIELNSWIMKSHESSVVSVAKLEGFSRSGGIIELFNVGPRLKFKINLDAADASGIRISSKLTKLARRKS
jgi:hypothetical protein